jgi:nitroreductase
MDILFKRKSVRSYKPDAISEEDLNYILKAAQAAPSAGNAREWHFIVVKNKNTHEEIMKIHPASLMLKNAPVAIIVCANLDEEKYPGYWPQDTAAAVQNILLAATAKGLGSVWCGVYPNAQRYPKFIELFKLPKNVMPAAMVVLGYENGETPDKQRWEPSKIKYEAWS